MSATILVTGFEPYGGMPSNPAFDAARLLDGETIAGHGIAGRILPVSLRRLPEALDSAIRETAPAAVVCLGLYPGEAAIRLERVGLNLADFALGDNDGATMRDAPVAGNGETARFATLPLRAIERALLDAGTPARISETAGTYLCNACLYLGLGLADGVPCGFLHLPMTPELAAARMKEGAETADGRGLWASMEFARIVESVRIAIRETISASAGIATGDFGLDRPFG